MSAPIPPPIPPGEPGFPHFLSSLAAELPGETAKAGSHLPSACVGEMGMVPPPASPTLPRHWGAAVTPTAIAALGAASPTPPQPPTHTTQISTPGAVGLSAPSPFHGMGGRGRIRPEMHGLQSPAMRSCCPHSRMCPESSPPAPNHPLLPQKCPLLPQASVAAQSRSVGFG